MIKSGGRPNRKSLRDNIKRRSMEVDTELGWSVTEDDGQAYLDGSFEVVKLPEDTNMPLKSIAPQINSQKSVTPKEQMDPSRIQVYSCNTPHSPKKRKNISTHSSHVSSQ